MGKAEAIARLRAFEPKLRALGAESAFLFGSTFRGDERDGSDIDVLLNIRGDASFTLLDLAATRRLLSDGLAVPVDVVTSADLSPQLERRVRSEAARIF